MKKNLEEIIISIYYTDEGCKEELEPEIITKLTGIKPTNIIKKGDPIFKKKLKANVNLWEVGSGLTKSATIEDHLNSIKNIIEPKKAIFKKLSKKWKGYFSYVHYLYGYGECVPLEKKWVKWISELGLGIIIDIYSMEEE